MLTLRPFSPLDIPFGLSLSRRAGWNQLDADWQRAFALQPDGCFVAEWNGARAGTTTTCLFGDVGWIAMVLVEETLRSRGIGTALLRQALDFLEGQGAASIWLDATPLGRPLYEKLGFGMEGTLLRLEGIAPPGIAISEVRPVSPENWSDLFDLDRAVYGYDRSRLLRWLTGHETAFGVAREGRLLGFSLARPGARAWKIGPLLAFGEAGEWLLKNAFHRLAGEKVFVDVPEQNLTAIQEARAAGLTVQRPLFRMCRGRKVPWDARNLWSSFGPEKG